MTKEEIIEQIGEKLSPFTGVKPKVIADILLEILNASDLYNDLYVSKSGDEDIEGVKTFLGTIVAMGGLISTDMSATNITASTSLGGGSLSVTGNGTIGGDLEVTGNIIGSASKWGGLDNNFETTSGSNPIRIMGLDESTGKADLYPDNTIKSFLGIPSGDIATLTDIYDESSSSTMPTASSLNASYGSKPDGFRVYFQQFDRTYTKSSLAINGWFITDVSQL